MFGTKTTSFQRQRLVRTKAQHNDQPPRQPRIIHWGGCPCCRKKTGRGADRASSSDAATTSAPSRRNLLGGLLSSTTPLLARPAQAEPPTSSAPSFRLPFYDNYFASAMQTGMAEYEEAIAPVKRRLFAKIRGGARVLEVGVGTAPNLPFYPPNVKLIGIDPNPVMLQYAEKNARAAGRELETAEGTALRLPFANESMDYVVSTLVFCSVPSPQQALEEIRRVLKPGGKFIFIEHVADRQPGVRRTLQFAFNPLQVLLADGCHLTRDTLGTLQSSGVFRKIEAEELDLDGMFLIAPHVAGIATV